jgi:hypothetical protein
MGAPRLSAEKLFGEALDLPQEHSWLFCALLLRGGICTLKLSLEDDPLLPGKTCRGKVTPTHKPN